MKTRGFTLVEIMIVAAIISLLAALSIPALMRARVNADEGMAIKSLRSISTAVESYRAAKDAGYPADLAELATFAPSFIDELLSSGSKQGYSFNYTPGNTASDGKVYSYTCVASPVEVNVTGSRSFFLDESGVIRIGEDSTGTAI